MESFKIKEEAFRNKNFVQKRLLLSCSMCKKNKIKCNKDMPQCESCFKKGVPCLSVCPSTKREVPRSYLLYLEDLLCVYFEKLTELGVDCEELKSNFPSTAADSPVNVDLYRERFTENNELFDSKDKYIKRISQVKLENKQGDGTDLALKRTFSELDKQENASSIIKMSKKKKKRVKEEFKFDSFKSEAVAITPSNSSISKSNILESFNSATTMTKTDSLYHSNLEQMSSDPNHNTKSYPLSSTTNPVISIEENSKAVEENTNNEIKTYLGDSSGIPFAKLMLTAINFETIRDNTDHEEEEIIKNDLPIQPNEDQLNQVEIPIVEDNVNFLHLPSFTEAEKLIIMYFNRMNPQYPVFEFSMFYNLYFTPLYGDDVKLNRNSRSKKQSGNLQHYNDNYENIELGLSISLDEQTSTQDDNIFSSYEHQKQEADNSKLPQIFKLTLDSSYFSFIELLKQKYPSTELYYFITDAKYVDKVVPLKNLLELIAKLDDPMGIFESDIELPFVYQRALFFTNLVMSLGSCSEVLLNGTIHSITLKKRAMRWMDSVLNDSVQISYEESGIKNDLQDSPIFRQMMIHFRKLESLSGLLLISAFSMCVPSIPSVWYSMGIPLRLLIDLGLHNEKYNVELLSSLAACDDPKLSFALKNNAHCLIDIRRRLFWTAYSMDRQLALYFGRPVSLSDESIALNMISSKPPGTLRKDLFSQHTRLITLAMMEIRKLQSEILYVMYAPRSQLPREFKTLDDWKKSYDKRLNKWYSQVVPKKLEKIGYMKFKREFFRINLYHTKTMLNGISPRCNTQHTEQELLKLYTSTKNMIYQYHRLWISKSLNYTWIACHNLFMCSMTFLYTRYKCNDLESLEETCDDVLEIIKAFVGTCEAAPNCYKSIKVLSRAVKKLIIKTTKRKEKFLNESPISINMSGSESLDTDPEMQLFFEKLLDSNNQILNQISANKETEDERFATAPKPSVSDEIDSIWGLDDEYKHGGNHTQSVNSISNITNFGEEQIIYDMLYSHSNQANVRDWAGSMLSPNGAEIDNGYSGFGIRRLLKEQQKHKEK